MRKIMLSVVMILSFVCVMCLVNTTEAANDPALSSNGLYDGKQVLMGTWIDVDSGRKYHFTTQTTSYCGWEWADNHRDILFADRGAHFALRATWYPDQNQYYAKLFINSTNGFNGRWNTAAECLMKVSND